MANENHGVGFRHRGRPPRHQPRATNFDLICDRLCAAPKAWFCARCIGTDVSIARNTVLMLFLRLDADAAFRRTNGDCSVCGMRRIVASFVGRPRAGTGD